MAQGSFRRTAKRTGNYLFLAFTESVNIFVGSLTVLSLLIASSWAIFFTAVVGTVLILFRNWFMQNAAFIAANAEFFTTMFNTLITFADVASDVLEIVVDVIGGLATLIAGHPAFPSFKLVNLPQLNKTGLEIACTELPRACAGVDTPVKLWELAIMPYSSNATCGFFRYFYPVPWVFDLLYPVGKGLRLTYAPYPPGSGPDNAGEFQNNCKCEPQYGCSYRWECIVLGSGYWVLEFLLPLIIFAAAWQGWIQHILKLAGYLALAAGTIAVRAISFFANQGNNFVGLIERGIDAIKTRRALNKTRTSLYTHVNTEPMESTNLLSGTF